MTNSGAVEGLVLLPIIQRCLRSIITFCISDVPVESLECLAGSKGAPAAGKGDTFLFWSPLPLEGTHTALVWDNTVHLLQH